MNSGNSHAILSQKMTAAETQIATKRPRLPKKDFDKFLMGRSYAVFRRAIKTQTTLDFYRRNLCYFLSHIGMTTEEVVEKYSPYIVTKDGEHKPNVQGQIALQKLVEEYMLYLAERVDRGEIKPSSVITIMPAVKLFLDMSDCVLNWSKLNKLLPRGELVAEDEAYSREDISRLLAYSDLRGKLVILLLVSSGMRLGGLANLKMGDITPIYDTKDPARLLAAHVKVYAGTEDEYDTFITPEAWKCLQTYRALRESWGETITKESPVLLKRFCKETLVEGRAQPMRSHTIQELLIRTRKKAGVDVRSKHYNDKRFTIKTCHGTRKLFDTTVKRLRTPEGQRIVAHDSKEKLMGHRLRGDYALDEAYDRSDMVKELLQDYLKAIPSLTISDEERLQLQVNSLQEDIENFKSLDIVVAAKDKELREMKAKMEAMEAKTEKMIERKVQEILERVDVTKLERKDTR